MTDSELLLAVYEGMSELNQRTAKLEQGMTEVKQDVADLKQDMTEVKQDMTEVKQDMTEVKQDVALLNEVQISGLRIRVDSLEKEVAEMKDRIA